MASGINKVILVGNLGDDPDIKYTQSDVCVANFSIATSERWKDRDGEQQERTEWHRVVFFGKVAEIIGEYATKGMKVYVEGKLRTEKYTDRDDIERYSTKVYGDDFQMLSSRNDGGGGGGQQRNSGGQRGGDTSRSNSQQRQRQQQRGGGQQQRSQGGQRQQGGQGRHDYGSRGPSGQQRQQGGNQSRQDNPPVDDFADDDIPF